MAMRKVVVGRAVESIAITNGAVINGAARVGTIMGDAIMCHT